MKAGLSKPKLPDGPGQHSLLRNTAPRISVVVPMFNAGPMILECLAPLLLMLDNDEICEIVVVNDASTDDSAARVVAKKGVQLLNAKVQSGPALARNLGADIAQGDYLWFVDADVIVAADAGSVVNRILAEPSVVPPDAFFGSYDTEPRAMNFLSQYKNLAHHYYHANASEVAETFWSGCGLVKREVFLQIGGFDVERFPHPSVEDIDLGYRLRDRGYTIRLVKELRGKHLKEWRLQGLLHTEIFRRAMPWSRLMLTRKSLINDLNVGFAERARALLVGFWGIAFITFLAGLASSGWLIGVSLVLIFANRPLYLFFASNRGPLFALCACAFQQLYYAYSSVAFAYVWFQVKTCDQA